MSLLSVLILVSLQPACNTSSSGPRSPLVCDGFRDCEDGQDEQNCTQSEEEASALCSSSCETPLSQNRNPSVGLGLSTCPSFPRTFPMLALKIPCPWSPLRPRRHGTVVTLSGVECTRVYVCVNTGRFPCCLLLMLLKTKRHWAPDTEGLARYYASPCRSTHRQGCEQMYCNA